MRRTLSGYLAPFALLANACTWHPYVNGTVNYSTSPPLDGGFGALPLSTIVCARPVDSLASIRFGDQCTLSGAWMPVGRHAFAGIARLGSHGECALPAANGMVIPLRGATATLQIFGEAVDATVGGVTSDGRYVTYRFTGTAAGEAPEEACAGLKRTTLRSSGSGTTDGTTEVAPGREAWESWVPAPPTP
jgi:hypothetical protein